MKTRHSGIAALAGLCLALAGSTLAATDRHAAGHAHEAPAKLELDHGKRWATAAAPSSHDISDHRPWAGADESDGVPCLPAAVLWYHNATTWTASGLAGRFDEALQLLAIGNAHDVSAGQRDDALGIELLQDTR